VAQSTVWTGPHWDPKRAAAGDLARYVDVKWDRLAIEPILALEYLQRTSPFSTWGQEARNWTPPSSGISIPADIAEALKVIWPPQRGRNQDDVTDAPEEGNQDDIPDEPEEVDPTRTYVEGTMIPRLVHACVRSAKARADCIRYHGTTCACCAFDFEATYGLAGKGYIQAHHLRPLGKIKKAHRVDPIHDMRPLCANCHAIVHLREPIYSLEEVRAMVEESLTQESGEP
jgi:5-methylcytosine-specific restriction protein A